MRGQSQAFDIVHNYANGLFDEVFCNEISGPGVWWPGSISGGPMNYSGYVQQRVYAQPRPRYYEQRTIEAGWGSDDD